MDSIWTTRDTLAIQRIGAVEPSPDGKRAVFSVTQAEMTEEKSGYLTQIYLASASDGQTRQLTASEFSSFYPQWSPDGQSIAFLSRNNIWRMPVDGGKAQQVTDVRTAVSSFKWSPDGSMIAFTALEEPLPVGHEESIARIVGQDHRRQCLNVVSLLETSRQPSPGHLLTGSEIHVGAPQVPEAYQWSPDCRTIMFSHSPSPQQNDWPGTRLARLRLDDGSILPLGTDQAAVYDPHVSPDGGWIACKVYDHPAWEWSSVVQLIPIEGGPERTLAETFDRRPDLIGWSADGNWIYFLETCGTRLRLCALPADGNPPVVLFDPEGCIENARINPTRNTLGFTFQTVSHPPEACITPLSSISPLQLSQLNVESRQPPLGRTEVIRWKSVDGLEIEGLLSIPPGYQRARRCPLLVSVHGGPAIAWIQSFVGMQSFYGPIAAFLAKDYAILRCNVRGSTGYGKAFRRGNFRDWGGKDVQDLLSGVDHVVGLGIADPERLGIIGWSYGGYLTAATLTQTERFRAAVIGAGMSDLVSYATGNDSPDYLPTHFGGEIWEVGDLLLERSPIAHADRVTTPTLILHGEQDQRVPIWQGFEFYNALARCGCPAQMVVYPDCGHVPSKPNLLLDVMDRTLAWMELHIRDRVYPEEDGSRHRLCF